MVAKLLSALALTLMVSAPEKVPKKEVPLFPVEEQILEKTNAARARHGLPPLELDQKLVQSARQHCYWMAQSGNFVHTSKPVAENIALGQRDASEALTSWMNSSGHRANILSGSYRRIGIAAYQAGGTDGPIYWCQQFLQ